MRKNIIVPLLITAAALGGCGGKKQPVATQADDVAPFVTVRDGKFYLGDSTYKYIGTNFWYGAILASEGRGGNPERLARELDSLKAMGIDNLRVLAGGDGDEGLASHISPTLQTAPGVYNDTLLRGLDNLLAELEKRDMRAVIYLNNAWEWSGGYSTYLEWAGAGKAVNPADAGYPAYMKYASQFVTNDSAKALAANHVRNIVSRVSTVSGLPYSKSPAIMAWQIANEPRPFSPDNKKEFAEWIGETAALIKSIDPNHLVSVGSEGTAGCEEDMTLWTAIHLYPDVDYATIHIWPYNWSWIIPTHVADSVSVACDRTTAYINNHFTALRDSLTSNGAGLKPIVLEEFGYPRDGMATATGSAVTGRDAYYEHVFRTVTDTDRLAGVNFWGWGGFAEPAHETWRPGDDYTGDPAQEAQGLNSVFATDSSTIDIIKRAASRL